MHLRVQTWTAPEAPGALVESRTWPPLTVLEVDGWRVGLSGGLTRRANSALLVGVPTDPAAALDRVEQAYAAEGLPTLVRAPRPEALASRDARGAVSLCGEVAALLDARGYSTVSETDVLVRSLVDEPALPDRLELPGVQISVRDEPDDSWLALWLGAKVDSSRAPRSTPPSTRRVARSSPAPPRCISR